MASRQIRQIIKKSKLDGSVLEKIVDSLTNFDKKTTTNKYYIDDIMSQQSFTDFENKHPCVDQLIIDDQIFDSHYDSPII
jgi:hypothetical protein